MTSKTVAWIAPELNEWANPKKGGAITYFVNVIFSDDESGSVGKESRDEALYLKGLLEEAKDNPIEFTLESKGTNKKGKSDWRIKAFGDYQPVQYNGSQGGGGSPASSGGHPRLRSPEHDQFIQERMDRRTAAMQAVALMGEMTRDEAFNPVVRDAYRLVADDIYKWLRETSGVSAPPHPGVDAAGASDAPVVPGEVTEAPGMAAEVAPADGEGADSPGTAHVHDLDMGAQPKAGGRLPCRTCHAWAKPVRT